MSHEQATTAAQQQATGIAQLHAFIPQQVLGLQKQLSLQRNKI